MEVHPIHCPNCGKAYRWQSKIAGKKVRCVCTQKFRVPMSATGKPAPHGPLVGRAPGSAPGNAPGNAPKKTPEKKTGRPPEKIPATPAGKQPPKGKAKAPEPDPYELDLPEEHGARDAAPLSARSDTGRASPGAAGGKCPSCNSPLREGAVICLNCGFNIAAGAKLQTVVAGTPTDDEDDPEADAAETTGVPGADRVLARTKLQDDLASEMAQRHHFQENLLPLIFLGAGAVLMMVNAFVLVPMIGGMFDLPFSVGMSIEALIYFFILFTIQIPCLFVGILIISKLFGSAFGTLSSALKKLTALALLGGQFHVMVDLGFNIMLGGFGFIAFWVKFSLSFGLFWILSKQLFDELEFGETVTLWLAMLFLPIFVAIGVIAVLAILFG